MNGRNLLIILLVTFFSCSKKGPSEPVHSYPLEVIFLVSGTSDLVFYGYYGHNSDTLYIEGNIPDKIPNSTLYFTSVENSFDTAFIQIETDQEDCEMTIQIFAEGREKASTWMVTPCIIKMFYP